MALSAARLSLTGAQACRSKLGRSVLPLTASRLNPVQVTLVATLKATHGGKYPYPPAFPYEKKKYKLINQFYDHTEWRLGENSKVITIDGNIAVGKNEFGKKMASEFDLKFFPAVTDDEVYKTAYGYDLRGFNNMLPEGSKVYDLKMFYQDEDPRHGRVGSLQFAFYLQKYHQYCKALHHLLNTGQGVVIVNSVYSDHVFADTLRELGYIKPKFHRVYREVRANTICNLLKPHMCFYLEAPVSSLRKNINKQNNPAEVNSKILTDEYLETLDKNYRERFLNQMKPSSEVMEIDWTQPGDDMDMDVIAEEMQWIRLESEDADDPRFHDWHSKSMDEWDGIRQFTGSPTLIGHLFQQHPLPLECPEVLFTGEAYHIMKKYIEKHPVMKYAPKSAPEFGYNPYLRLW